MRLAQYSDTGHVVWGRMESCAPVRNPRRQLCLQGYEAGYQPAAGVCTFAQAFGSLVAQARRLPR